MKVYIGIDWSKEKHDANFMNEAGQAIQYCRFAHTQTGFLELDAARQKLGVDPSECIVGIETSYNLLVDALWNWGYEQVYVLPPSAVNRSRGRYKQSKARTDRSDAWLIANLLRTELHNFHPWRPNTALTRHMSAQVNLVFALTKESQRMANQLRAVLWRYYPAALEIFSGLNALISLEFICAYPTPRQAARLTLAQLRHFAENHHYNHSECLPKYFAQLQKAYPQAAEDTVSSHKDIAVQLAKLLSNILRSKRSALTLLQQLFRQHPDCAIYQSLPGAGKLLEPALLVKFGDDRSRYPSASVVQALAGTCPVTDASGKRKKVYFRRACDQQFRQIAQQWAKASIKESDWAAAYFQQAQERCRSDSHAYRCLANRWLAILWRLWQDDKPYDENYHLQQRLLHGRPIQ
jgi:transposase